MLRSAICSMVVVDVEFGRSWVQQEIASTTPDRDWRWHSCRDAIASSDMRVWHCDRNAIVESLDDSASEFNRRFEIVICCRDHYQRRSSFFVLKLRVSLTRPRRRRKSSRRHRVAGRRSSSTGSRSSPAQYRSLQRQHGHLQDFQWIGCIGGCQFLAPDFWSGVQPH